MRTVKAHLTPSLSAVASRLMNRMTGGRRNVIEVDEEFDVRVDGQRLATLSGSAKACANLALRIGLGQVLTHRRCSLLLADEIDAAMDAERAQESFDCLRQLALSISQIIVVSHKLDLDADHRVELGA